MVAPASPTHHDLAPHDPDTSLPPLVEAKFHPPATVSGTVTRPRLIAPLLDVAGPPVVALVAGPGYGKTTLLAQWVAQEPRPVAWLTLDDLDNDPVILVAYLEAAIGRIQPRTAANGDGVTADARHPVRHAVPRLLDQLHRWRRPAVIVLDDAHRIVDPTSSDVLAALLDHLPRGFRVAVAGRHQPALPLARWRAGRRLLDVDEVDLALDAGETAAVVASAGGRLTPDELRALATRTEGWAAATYLAALSSGRVGAVTAQADGAPARDRFLAEYLRSEVGASLTPDDVDFLARTSVLETVSPDVATALTGVEGPVLRLRAIARRNLLVHEIGAAATTFRYHFLLREFLLDELERATPGATRALHARASDWYAGRGELVQAVEHVLRTDDREGAARLVTAAIVPAMYSGRAATVDRWLAGFETETFRAYPPLAAMAAWRHLLAGRTEWADRMADIVDAAEFDGSPADGSTSFASQRALIRVEMCRRGVGEALEDAELAAEQEAGSRWRTATFHALGSMRWLLGDEAGAEAVLEDAVGRPPVAGAAGSAAHAKLASIQLRRGDWHGAQDHAERAKALLRDTRWDGTVAAFFVHAVCARVAIARGDRATGQAELVQAQLARPSASSASPWVSVDALLELARAYLAVSDPGGAQTAVREAEAIVRVRPALGVLVGELVELRGRVGGATDALAGSSTLTSAELRVLPLLPTYLSFQDIADRLRISRNTVKTHAMSIYGKLWASSRGEAVERAVELGLLEPYPGLDRFDGARSTGGEAEQTG